MYIIEALKEVKALRKKISDLSMKIRLNSAHTENRPTDYKDPAAEIKSWQTQIHAATQRMEELLLRISYTNLMTKASIKIGDNIITKSLAAWNYRRRELSALDLCAWATCSNRGLQVEIDRTETNKVFQVILNFDAKTRDWKITEYSNEPGLIDTRLETVNATTELLPLEDIAPCGYQQ